MEKTVWSKDEVEGNEAVIIFFTNGKSVRGRIDDLMFTRASEVRGYDFRQMLRTGKTIVNMDAVSFAHIWHEKKDEDI